MPNRNANYLNIKDSPNNLVKNWWLIETTDNSKYGCWFRAFRFNLHKIFPDKFNKPYRKYKCNNSSEWKTDEILYWNTFDDLHDYAWYIENVWTKWDFDMDCEKSKDSKQFYSYFDTARSPPNELLKTFHNQSNIWLINEYEEPWIWFEWKLDCSNWIISDSLSDYIQICSLCEKKDVSVIYNEKSWEELCSNCL